MSSESTSSTADTLSKLFAAYVNDYVQEKEVLVIKTGTPVEQAIVHLVEHNLQSAPVYDDAAGKYLGWIDSRDLVALVVRAYHAESEEAGFKDLKSMLLRSRAIDKSPVEAVIDLSKNNPFVPIYTGQLMIDVLLVLAEGVHRVPVIDPETGRICKIISQSDILRFLGAHGDALGPQVMDKTLEELHMARRDTLIAVPASAPPLRAFELMAEHKLSGLPVVEDGTGNLLTNVSASDVTALIRAKQFDFLHRKGRGGGDAFTIMDFVSQIRMSRTTDFVAAASCSATWTLRKAVAKLVATKVHRLYVVEGASRRLVGVVSLRDILQAVARVSAGGPDAAAVGGK